MLSGLRRADLRSLREDVPGAQRERDCGKKGLYAASGASRNDKKISEKVISVSRGRKAAFALLVCALTVAEIFLVKACCAHLFGGIYAEIFLDLESSDSFQITLLLSLVAVAINLGAFAAVVRAKRGKKTVGEKK